MPLSRAIFTKQYRLYQYSRSFVQLENTQTMKIQVLKCLQVVMYSTSVNGQLRFGELPYKNAYGYGHRILLLMDDWIILMYVTDKLEVVFAKKLLFGKSPNHVCSPFQFWNRFLIAVTSESKVNKSCVQRFAHRQFLMSQQYLIHNDKKIHILQIIF